MTLGSHQRTVGASQVHLTPRWIIDALGPFDMDPCAATVRPFDCAAVNLTEADDGLSRQWGGRVWLNPPFDRYKVGAWIDRLAEHGNGIALLHARTETDWFGRAWSHADAMLFMGQRIIFLAPDGSPQKTKDKIVGGKLIEGKVANSGAPVVLVAFGQENVIALRDAGIHGRLCRGWSEVGKAVAA